MDNKIFIKLYFGDWVEVNKEQAKKFCENLIKGFLACKIEDIPRVLNEKHLKGITYEELFIS